MQFTRPATWDDVKTIDIDGQPLRVLDLPGLLKTKQGLRPKDQMDAAVIAAAIEALGQPGK